MLATEIQAHARRMYDAQGAKALAEAAQKAKSCEASGAAAEAADWRRIEAALKELAGPRSK